MKIGVVSRSDIDIFSPKEGAAVKLYYTMKSLDSLGEEVFFITEDNEKYWKVEDGNFEEIEYPGVLKGAFNNLDLYKKIITFLGVPEEDWVLFHPLVNLNYWLRTLYVTLKEDIDILHSEFPAFGVPALFSKLFTSTEVSLIEHNVEYFRIKESSPDISERGENTIKLTEKLVGNFSDYVITVSPEDKERLKKLEVRTDEIIPHGVDIARIEGGNGSKIREKLGIEENENLLIFHGVLNYSPNMEAVKAIIEDILPSLKELEENFKILIVGGNPPEITEEEIITTGFVKDIEDYIKAADAAIVPLKSGGGTRMKILEYFAAEIPIISTRKGVEGLDVSDGKELVIADIEKFPEEISKLLEDQNFEEKLVKNGRDFVDDLDWKKIGKTYQKLYKSN